MNRRFFHIISLLAMLALFSCRKETSIERPESLNGTFMADVNGSQWIAADTLQSATILGGFINLTGISADHRQLSITLNDTIPGPYVLNQTSTSAAIFGYIDSSGIFVYSTNQGSDTTQAGGTVTVTEIDPIGRTISGTFSFNVYRDVDGKQQKLTNGVFRKLPYVDTLPAASGNDTLYATIEASKWSAQSISAMALSNQLIISGSDLGGNQSLGLNMPANITPGHYTLDFTQFTYFGAYIPGPNIGLASFGDPSKNTLDILENDVTNRRIRGNFAFTAVDPTDPLGMTTPPRNITAGHFAVTYQ